MSCPRPFSHLLVTSHLIFEKWLYFHLSQYWWVPTGSLSWADDQAWATYCSFSLWSHCWPRNRNIAHVRSIRILSFSNWKWWRRAVIFCCYLFGGLFVGFWTPTMKRTGMELDLGSARCKDSGVFPISSSSHFSSSPHTPNSPSHLSAHIPATIYLNNQLHILGI